MKKHAAVITADIVNSTHFAREDVSGWLNELIEILRNHESFQWALKPEVYRGDSFQGVLKNPGEAVRAAVLARAIMRSHAPNTDLRIAIGIGKTEPLTDRPGTSDGEAFRLSGHLADNIRKQKARIGVAFPVPSEPVSASLNLLETIIETWTTAQSEVIVALLQKNNVTQIAEKLSISQPAVSQRIAASKWWAVENFLAIFPEYLPLYTKRS